MMSSPPPQTPSRIFFSPTQPSPGWFSFPSFPLSSYEQLLAAAKSPTAKPTSDNGLAETNQQDHRDPAAVSSEGGIPPSSNVTCSDSWNDSYDTRMQGIPLTQPQSGYYFPLNPVEAAPNNRHGAQQFQWPAPTPAGFYMAGNQGHHSYIQSHRSEAVPYYQQPSSYAYPSPPQPQPAMASGLLMLSPRHFYANPGIVPEAQYGPIGESFNNFEFPQALIKEEKFGRYSEQPPAKVKSPSLSPRSLQHPNRGERKRRLDCSGSGSERHNHDRPRMRHNKATRGLSSRTVKKFNYNPIIDGGYEETANPVANWTSSSGEFEYLYHAEGELKNHECTPEEMTTFLTEHPLKTKTEKGHLTLWIQKTPADSGERYLKTKSNKCRFMDCPTKSFKEKGSIGVGLFRVAIDEQWETYGEKKDPFHVAAYVHLYCLERFCDFRGLCRWLNVRADDREQMRGEPRQRFAGAIASSQVHVARQFIRNCVAMTMEQNYPNYPPHNEANPTAEKRHDGTLTYLLTVDKNEKTNASKKAMMMARGNKNSHILVHKGNLQMAVSSRLDETSKRQELMQRVRSYDTPVDDEDYDDNERPKKKRRRHSIRQSQRKTLEQPIKLEDDSSDEQYSPGPRQLRRSKRNSGLENTNKHVSSDLKPQGSHRYSTRHRLGAQIDVANLDYAAADSDISGLDVQPHMPYNMSAYF